VDIELTAQYKKAIDDFLKVDKEKAYTYKWCESLVNGDLIKNYNTIKNFTEIYRRRSGIADWKSDVSYDGYLYSEVINGFVGCNGSGEKGKPFLYSYHDNDIAPLLKKWDKLGVKYSPMLFSTTTNSDSKYFFSNDKKNSADVTTITYKGRHNSNGVYSWQFTNKQNLEGFESKKLFLYRIDGKFGDYQGDRKQYASNVVLSLILEDAQGNETTVFSIDYYRLRVMYDNNPRYKKHIQYYLQGEKILHQNISSKYNTKYNLFVLLGNGYVRIYMPSTSGKFQYYAKSYSGSYTKARFKLLSQMGTSKLPDTYVGEVSIHSLDINNAVDLLIQRNTILFNISKFKKRGS
jgi:hypothetical protein